MILAVAQIPRRSGGGLGAGEGRDGMKGKKGDGGGGGVGKLGSGGGEGGKGPSPHALRTMVEKAHKLFRLIRGGGIHQRLLELTLD